MEQSAEEITKITAEAAIVEVAPEYLRRNAVLREMGFKDYRDYLASELWQTIKRKVMGDGTRKCEVCRKAKAYTLHHKCYTKEVMLGLNRLPLVPICKGCHYAIEFNKDEKVRRLHTVNKRLKRRAGMFKMISNGKKMNGKRRRLPSGSWKNNRSA